MGTDRVAEGFGCSTVSALIEIWRFALAVRMALLSSLLMRVAIFRLLSS